MTSVAESPDRAGFLEALLADGLFTATGVPGVYGRSETFETVVRAVDALVGREGAADGAIPLQFPPVVVRRDLERSGYLASFPHLAGTVFSFDGDEAAAVDLAQKAAAHEDWSGHQAMADLCLTPAACYPVYPLLAGRGPLLPGGTLVDVGGWCFRNEPSDDPARLQSFRMHENVRVGEPDVVAAWHASWLERAAGILAGLGLEVDVVPANDPFFGRAGRILASGQRDQGLKMEVVTPLSDERPGAAVSVNLHRDHFGTDFGIVTSDGGVAHTACMGFGLERVTLALLRRHGLRPGGWPDAVRQQLRLEG